VNPRRDEQTGRALLLWLIAVGVVGFLTAMAARGFLKGDTGDFVHFHEAFRAVMAGEDLYRSGTGGYIYPPLFAVLFAPLGLLPMGLAGAVFSVVNGGLVLLCLWLSADEAVRRLGARDSRATVPAAMLVSLAIFGDKLRSELLLGQTDMLILLGLLLALRWLDRRPLLAGLALGFAGNVKYQSLVMPPYLLIRGRWKAFAASVVSLTGLAFASALVFGWSTNLDYLRRALGGLGRMMGDETIDDAAGVYPITWLRSISLPSVFARIQEWAGCPAWTLHALILAAAGAALAGVILLYRRHGVPVFKGRGPARDGGTDRGRALVLLEWTGLIVALMVFGPQTTARHMVVMIPLGCLAGVLLLVPRPGVKRLPVLAASVFLLLAFVLPPGSGGDANDAANAWRWIGGISIATLTLLYVSLDAGLKWAAALPGERPTE
jgi:hypothetical protein